jgi:hypothetical protein
LLITHILTEVIESSYDIVRQSPFSNRSKLGNGYATVRDEMMHEPETKRKYELLLARVSAKLA